MCQLPLPLRAMAHMGTHHPKLKWGLMGEQGGAWVTVSIGGGREFRNDGWEGWKGGWGEEGGGEDRSVALLPSPSFLAAHPAPTLPCTDHHAARSHLHLPHLTPQPPPIHPGPQALGPTCGWGHGNNDGVSPPLGVLTAHGVDLLASPRDPEAQLRWLRMPCEVRCPAAGIKMK